MGTGSVINGTPVDLTAATGVDTGAVSVSDFADVNVSGTLKADNPIQGDITGNASTANMWSLSRLVDFSGDVTAQFTMDGSSDITAVFTAASTGVTPGVYGTGFSIPSITVDGKGRVLNASTVAINVNSLGAVSNAMLAEPGGVATLDAMGKLEPSQIPDSLIGAMIYRGVWNAATNTPVIVDGTGTKGDYYKVSVAGNTYIDANLTGHYEWKVGDFIAYNGATWDAIDGSTSEVISVAGRVGDVVLTTSDIGGLKLVAKTNSYHDLDDLPFIPTKVSQITNDSAFITAAAIPVTSVFGRIGAVSLTATDINNALGFTASAAYILAPATAAVLGGVKQGSGVTILADGTLNANVRTVAGRSGDVVLTKSDVGLANVDNTTDLAKPVSTAQALADAAILSAAASDATTKANAAITAAAADATTKSNAAVVTAEAGAAVDATAKANAAIAASTPIGHVGSNGAAHATATGALAGFLSAADKTKLDGIATGATANLGTVTSVSAAVPLVSSGGNTPILSIAAASDTVDGYLKAEDFAAFAAKGSGSGSVTNVSGVLPISVVNGMTTPQISIAAATTSAAGTMSAADKTKLDAITGSNTGDQTNITGNAGSATILQNTRTINGVSFNGSANITINAVDATARVAWSMVGIANGVASLDASGLIPATQLPSYVDDVLEYANLAGFPATGATGKIYVALDTNKTYRWGGSSYVYITSGAVDSVAGRTGIVTLTKSDVGLSNVDNTADSAKPVSTAQAAALALKQDKLGYVPYPDSNPSGYQTAAGSVWSAQTAASATAVSIFADDTTTNATYYPVLAAATSGNNSLRVSSTKLQFNPSTGLLSATDVMELSDERHKTRVETITGALDMLLAMRGVRYLKDGIPGMGVIAQEQQKVTPELVRATEDGTLNVIYSGIHAPTIEAMRELAYKLQDTQRELADLKLAFTELVKFIKG